MNEKIIERENFYHILGFLLFPTIISFRVFLKNASSIFIKKVLFVTLFKKFNWI